MATIEPSFQSEITARPATQPAWQLGLTRLEEAIVQAVAYSDIFDYPLTAREIHRYLMEVAATRSEVDQVLSNGRLVPRYLSSVEGYFTLPGRESIVETRRERRERARRAWAHAYRYGGIIASLPFVRMVAVTGELAMDNVGPTSDIDYFIVTEPGRLWLSRLMVVAVVRLAGSRGPEICPNYLLSERSLVIKERNLYTAHEVAQMVPISGMEIYQQLCDLNPWVRDYLPNASGAPRSLNAPVRGRFVRKLAEAVLRTRLGGRLERWEMERKIRKLTNGREHPESAYTPDRCKGHVDGHGERILSLYFDRWQRVKALMQ